MEIDDAVVRQLAELGFIAGGCGMSRQTEAIVAALEALRPGNERPALILAMSRLNLRDAAGAERILRERALVTNPDSALARAWLGLTLHQQGRGAERDRVLNEALNGTDTDDEALDMARHLLETPIG